VRILVVTQYFQPENFKSNDIAFELSKRGHDVTVLTGIPNYPQGKFYKGYGILKKRHERINGVSIYRAFLIPRSKGGGVMLALNYLSWAFIASIWAFFMALFRKYDAVFVHRMRSTITNHSGLSCIGSQGNVPLSDVFLGLGFVA
jgi:hypothetical protein